MSASRSRPARPIALWAIGALVALMGGCHAVPPEGALLPADAFADVEGGDAAADETTAADSDAGAEADTTADAGMDAEADTEADTEADSDTDSDTEADSDTDSDTEADAQTEIDTGPSCDPEACGDDNPCTDDGCEEGACVHLANAVTCVDDDACTGPDACAETICQAGPELGCDDGNGCTLDTCDQALGCSHTPTPALGCDDGDLCTSSDTCTAEASCQAGDPTNCDDGDACTADDCEASTGCSHDAAAKDATSCDDGDACTEDGTCAGGACQPGAAIGCDDGEVCTADSCQNDSGCAHAAAAGPCEDGDACTADDVCDDGVCSAGTAPECDDAEDCTSDGCDKAIGCFHLPNVKPCNDASACTDKDVCKDKVCGGGLAVDCDDGNGCTTDTCDKGDGCVHAPAEGLCSDDSDCTIDDACDEGTCVAGSGEVWLHVVSEGDAVAATAIVGLADGFAIAGWRAANGKADDAWVARGDAAGALKWKITLGGAQSDAALALAALPDGLIVGGFTDDVAAKRDGLLGRLDLDGKQVWQKAIDGPGKSSDHIYAVAADATGVTFAGNTYFDGVPHFDAWLGRANADGDVQWQTSFGGAGKDGARALVARGDGYALAGATESKGAGTADGWLVLTDLAGALVDDRTYGGVAPDEFLAMAGSGDGGLVIAGATSSGAAGLSDFWLMHTDANGEPLWTRTFGDKGAEGLKSIAVVDGGYAIAGVGRVAGSDSPAAWLGRTDHQGELQWQQHFGGEPGSDAAGVFADAKGFFVAGEIDQPNVLAAALIARTDPWGHSTCASAGACATVNAPTCDDDDPCTADSCDPKSGCTHDAVVDCLAAAAQDLDHDGIGGGDDPCPTVWNPDGKAAACAPLEAGFTKSRDVTLGQPGMGGGLSWQRRTNEPVEVPLVNGIADDSLIGWWKLDGNGKDATFGFNDGTVPEDASETTSVSGSEGGGLHVSAASGPIAIPNTQVLQPTTALTVAAWIRPSASGNAMAVVSEAQGGGFNLAVDETGAPGFSVWTTKWMGAFCSATVVPQRWTHLAGVYDGEAVRIFVDGALCASQPATGPIDYPIPVYLALGANPEPDGGFLDPFDGDLDDVLFFDRAVSPAELRTYVDSRKPYATSLVAGAQPDFDDVRITETTPWQAAHKTHFELIGMAAHSDTELSDVVAYWKMNGDTKEIVSGKTGAGQGWIPQHGRFGDELGSLGFYGAGELKSNVTLSIPVDPGITLEAWVRSNTESGGKRAILGTATGAGQGGSVVLFIDEDNILCADLIGNAGGGLWSSGVKIPANQWRHVGVTADKAHVRFYVGGLLVSEQPSTITSTFFPKAVVFVGAENTNNSAQSRMTGDLDDVIIHKVARPADYFAKRALGLPRVRFLAGTEPFGSAAGAHKVYGYSLRWGKADAVAVPPVIVGLDGKTTCEGLLSQCLGYEGWWRFDEGSGSVAVDEATGRRHGALVGASRVGASGSYAIQLGAGSKPGYVDLGSWSGPFVTGSFTVSMNAKTLAQQVAEAYLWARSSDLGALRLANGNAQFMVDNATLGASVAFPLAAPRWRAISVIYDGSLKRSGIGLDSEIVSGQVGKAMPSAGTKPLLVGRKSPGTHAQGLVADFRIYSRALTADELPKSPALGASFGDVDL